MKQTGLIYLALVGLLAALLFTNEAGAASSEGSRLLQRLTAEARKEGQLNLMVVSSVGEKGSRELMNAFKKRFGLEITMNADLSGQESQKFNQAVAEIKAGISPTFDLMQGSDENVLSLKDAGGSELIGHWEILLREIAPEAHKVKERVSPGELAGHSFVWSTRTVALLYNPKLISEAELPKTWKQMGDSKYRGAFSLPPWTTIALMGILKYDKDEWLEIVRGMGRNKREVLTYDAGVQRVLLGDLKFTYGNADAYFEHKAKDPKAPLAETFFEDLTPMRQVSYVVRKGAKHPHAAKLFALWVASPEANEIFQKHAFSENLVLSQGPISRKVAQALNQRKIKPASWFDSPQTLEKFRWLASPEGREYVRAMARAQREGK
ncbi:MAG: ABC transporter substrate-binding protein [Deltaproteobacteria bacterium]|nr:ABC transporter substrate-binding protein [Deltaproteobacteria bacterium]